ncbi:hypothetical protein [Actinomadura sp. WMMB 499]|uniref:hypothetical protein n=1 Tax=Actinomadura sp. WMMB 499 TaxID=1219491 RepID=UPI0012466397|nr:hypothetical protein [Actinomadura sp. WMMB 499]QFG25550.1 hypothetical protein F7P10_34810 [Actinomadura sp. WMMB 499]
MADGKRRDGGDDVGGAEAERTRPDQRLPERDGAPEESATAEDAAREEPGDERVAGETLVDDPSPRVPAEGWTAELPAPSEGGDETDRTEPDVEPSSDAEGDGDAKPVPEADATRPAPLPSVPRSAGTPEPEAPGDATTPAPPPAPEPAAPGPAPSVPAPRPGPAPEPAPPVRGGTGGAAAGRGESPTWHRQHYTVGAFLLAYGVMSLISGTLLWGDRREEIGDYFASGPSGPILVLAKAVQAVLVLVTVAAIARRRDTWFVPPLAGWMAGFALFAVLDVYTARWGGLLEHLLYLAGFVVLLFLSYGLSAKAQVGGAARASVPGQGPGPEGLTRTQELALAAINRLPRR